MKPNLGKEETSDIEKLHSSQESLPFPECLIDVKSIASLVYFFLEYRDPENEAEMLQTLMESVAKRHLNRAKFGISFSENQDLVQELTSAMKGVPEQELTTTQKNQKWLFGWATNRCLVEWWINFL